MRRITLMLICLFVVMAADAQFEKGKKYVGVSLSGLDLSYNGSEKGSFGLQAKLGYLFADDLMLTGQVEYDKKNDVPAAFSAGVGARYYIVQNGLYLGASMNYFHSNVSYDDFMPSIQIGYAFFLSETVTVEPEIYYNQSFKSHSDYSSIGLRIGFGIYL